MVSKLVDKYDNFFQRIFEILPGLLIWILLLAPIWAGFSFPLLVINVLLVLTVYWAYRAIMLTTGGILGFIQYRLDLKKDWLVEAQKLKRENLPNPETLPEKNLLPKHLIVIANYGEEYDVLCKSIKALMAQNYPRELIYLAISIEERKAKKDPEYAKRGEYLKRDFGEFFEDRLFFFVHPDNIDGEAIGAAANRAWGTENSVAELEKRGENISEFLITAPDGDVTFHKDYLAACSYKWLVSEKRNQKFYQTAVYTFNNNYWDVPILIRILSTSLTLPVLSSSVLEKFKRETFSCYSVNLKVMKDVDYWDTTLAIDDTTFYWRPYLHFHGDWMCEVFYIPLSADAIYDPSYVKNHVDQYRQYVRWGWGVISFPIGMKVLLKDPKIKITEKIYKVFHLFEVFVLWKVLAFLLTFGIPLILLINRDLDDLVISHSIPQTVSLIMTVASIFVVPSAVLKVLLMPPKPKKMKWSKFIFLIILELPLNFVVLMTFSFLPFIESTTRMMLGQKHAKSISWSEKRLASN